MEILWWHLSMGVTTREFPYTYGYCNRMGMRQTCLQHTVWYLFLLFSFALIHTAAHPSGNYFGQCVCMHGQWCLLTVQAWTQEDERSSTLKLTKFLLYYLDCPFLHLFMLSPNSALLITHALFMAFRHCNPSGGKPRTIGSVILIYHQR